MNKKADVNQELRGNMNSSKFVREFFNRLDSVRLLEDTIKTLCPIAHPEYAECEIYYGIEEVEYILKEKEESLKQLNDNEECETEVNGEKLICLYKKDTGEILAVHDNGKYDLNPGYLLFESEYVPFNGNNEALSQEELTQRGEKAAKLLEFVVNDAIAFGEEHGKKVLIPFSGTSNFGYDSFVLEDNEIAILEDYKDHRPMFAVNYNGVQPTIYNGKEKFAVYKMEQDIINEFGLSLYRVGMEQDLVFEEKSLSNWETFIIELAGKVLEENRDAIEENINLRQLKASFDRLCKMRPFNASRHVLLDNEFRLIIKRLYNLLIRTV